MFPFISFEWVWDMTHIVFHGALHFALTVISLGMAYCIVKSAIDVSKKTGSSHH